MASVFFTPFCLIFPLYVGVSEVVITAGVDPCPTKILSIVEVISSQCFESAMASVFFTPFCLIFPLYVGVSGSSAQSLLIATEHGIKIFDSSIPSVKTVHNLSASSVDFRYAKKDIYFVDGRTIFYSYYSEYIGGREEPVATVTADYTVNDLTVDWEHYRVYYSVRATRAIYETTLLGSSSNKMFSDVIDIQGLALDPYEQLLFCVTDKQLKSYDLITRTVHRVYDWSIDGITEVVQVAVNIHRKELVVVGIGEDGDWRMVIADYPHSHVRPALSSALLQYACAVAVFGDKVVWSTRNSLYVCHLSPVCDASNVTFVYESTEAITDVKLYSPLVQTPSPQAACQLCSHSCSLGPDQTVRCSCPQHMHLDSSGIFCEDELLTTWRLWVNGVLSEYVDTYIPFILLSCGVLVALISCGVCLLLTRFKKPGSRESISLDEWGDRCIHRRDV